MDRHECDKIETIRDKFNTLTLYHFAFRSGYYTGKKWTHNKLKQFTEYIHILLWRNHTNKQKKENLKLWIAADRFY